MNRMSMRFKVRGKPGTIGLDSIGGHATVTRMFAFRDALVREEICSSITTSHRPAPGLPHFGLQACESEQVADKGFQVLRVSSMFSKNPGNFRSSFAPDSNVSHILEWK